MVTVLQRWHKDPLELAYHGLPQKLITMFVSICGWKQNWLQKSILAHLC